MAAVLKTNNMESLSKSTFKLKSGNKPSPAKFFGLTGQSLLGPFGFLKGGIQALTGSFFNPGGFSGGSPGALSGGMAASSSSRAAARNTSKPYYGSRSYRPRRRGPRQNRRSAASNSVRDIIGRSMNISMFNPQGRGFRRF